MNRSETINHIATALAKAQAKFAPVIKGKKAEITAGRGYKYADLASVCEAIMPTLSEAGIALLQGSPLENLAVMETILIHGESGEWISTYAPIFEGRNGGAQGYGSGVTYARRYALLAAVGVAPEDDDDGAKASGADARRSQPPKNDMGATDGIKEAWVDGVKDGLAPGYTPKQFAEACAAQIVRDMTEKKTAKGSLGAWDKRAEIIDWIADKFPSIHQNLLDEHTAIMRGYQEEESDG